MQKLVQRRLMKVLLIAALFTGWTSWGQILSENFSTASGGDNTTTGGSGTAWAGNTNFPSAGNSQAYQAGGAVRIGSSSNPGWITSKALDLSQGGGNFSISFDVKGWSTVEGSIKITVTGLTSQTVTYVSKINESFQNKVVNFTGGTTNSTVKIETTAKRAFIDNVVIQTATPAVPSLSISGTPVAHGPVCQGVSASYVTYTISNTGATAAGINVTSNNPQFVVSNLSSTSIAANGSATYRVTFTPTGTAPQSATISVTSTTTGSNSPTSSLTGTTSSATQAVSSVTPDPVGATTATLKGDVTAVNACTVTTEKGFVYSQTSVNADPQNGGTGVTTTSVGSSVATGAYLLNISSLTPSTSYSYRAYVYNGVSYTYGDVLHFSTTNPTATLAGTLNEGSLNTATFTITLAGETFVGSGSFTGTGFTLLNAPSGVSITSVVRNSDIQATVMLSYNDTDFDSNVTTFGVNIPASHLTLGNPMTSGTLQITAVAESLSTTGTISFANQCVNSTSSTPDDITITGNAKAGNITISATTTGAFTYSLTSNGTYTAPLTFSHPGGAISKIIYVKFSPTLNQSYSDSFTISAVAAASIDRSAIGSVVNTPPTVTSPTYTDVTTTTAKLGGNITVAGCSPIVERGIYYSTTDGFANGQGTKVSVTGTFTQGTFTVDVTGLSPSTTYYFKAFASNGTTNSYSSAQGTFTTACDASSLPFTQGFDAATFPPNCWARYEGANGFGVDVDWSRDTDSYAGAGAAFINFDPDGATEDWLVTPPLIIPDNGKDVKLSFFQAQQLATVYNNQYSIRVSTTSQTSHASFVTIESYGDTDFGTNYSEKIVDLSDYAGQTIYVAFVMTQNNGDGWYIDNVEIKEYITAPNANEETVLNVAGTGFTANWDPKDGATGYRLDVATTSAFEETLISESFANITGTSQVTNLNTYTQSQGWTVAFSYANHGELRLSSNSNVGSIITPVLNLSGGGKGTISFDLSQYSNDDSTVVQVHIDANNTGSWVQLGSNISASNFSSHTINITGGTANSKIRIQPVAGSEQRFNISNIKIVSSKKIVGYDDLTVAGTSQAVTGLTNGSTYYYRVRAVDATTTSDNSNTITAVASVANLWNGTAWTAGHVPTTVEKAIIAGNYNTAPTNVEVAPGVFGNGAFDAGYLDVNSGTFTIASGTNVTIDNQVVVNNEIVGGELVGGKMVIETNGNLLQTADVDNSGIVSVEKDSAPIFRLDYAMWSSPTASGQTLKEFSPQTLDERFYQYNPLSDAYATIPGGTAPFAEGKSYLIRVANNHVPYITPEAGQPEPQGAPWAGTFVGVLNNGDVNVPVIPQGTGVQGYNAVGNPYASPINIYAFYAANVGTIADDSAIYFWRKKNDSDSESYARVTKAAYTANEDNDWGDAGNGVFTGNPANWVINSGQGFIVQALTNTVHFNNAMRRPVNNGQIFRSGEDEPAMSRLWLNLTGEGNVFSQTAIAYTEETTLDIDYGWDGKAFINDGDASFFSLAGENTLGIQARPSFDAADEVPVGYRIDTAGSYTIALDHMDGVFAADQDIFLRDNVLGVTHDLKDGGYTFTSEAGLITDRFDVIYADELGTDTPSFNANSVIVYKNGNAINISSGNTDMTSVSVYDMRGRLLYSADNINATETVISGLQAEKQVLIVNIATAKGEVSKKIIF